MKTRRQAERKKRKKRKRERVKETMKKSKNRERERWIMGGVWKNPCKQGKEGSKQRDFRKSSCRSAIASCKSDLTCTSQISLDSPPH
jgi:hypothetical protein